MDHAIDVVTSGRTGRTTLGNFSHGEFKDHTCGAEWDGKNKRGKDSQEILICSSLPFCNAGWKAKPSSWLQACWVIESPKRMNWSSNPF